MPDPEIYFIEYSLHGIIGNRECSEGQNFITKISACLLKITSSSCCKKETSLLHVGKNPMQKAQWHSGHCFHRGVALGRQSGWHRANWAAEPAGKPSRQ